MDPENPVTLHRTSKDEAARWDAIVEASPHGTVYHTWAWVSAMARHSWMKLLGERVRPIFHPLIAEHDGKDIGLIPLYEFRGRLFSYVYSPPHNTSVTYLGPCLSFPEGLKRAGWERLHRSFHDAVNEYLRRLKVQCICIQTPPGYEDTRPYLWLGYNVTPLYNYSLDIGRPVETIWQDTRKDFRNRVRNAEKEGCIVEDGTFNDLKTLYEKQTQRYTEQNLRMNVSLEYLTDLWENLEPGSLQVLRAQSGGQYTSATLQTCYKDRVSAWMGCTKNTPEMGSENYLLHWKAIERAATQGFKEYENVWAHDERLNLFKTKTNPGLNSYHCATRMEKTPQMAYALRRYLKGGKIWGAGL